MKPNILVAFRASLIFAACFTGAPLHAAPAVTGMQLVSEARISRTVFDYTYRITIVNDGTARKDVVAQVASVGAGTEIRDGTVTVGALAANQQVAPADAITLRHDRTQPFLPAAIVWIVNGTDVPPPNGNPPPGILVPGDPQSSIGQSMPDHDAPRVVPASEISTDPDTGNRIIRTAIYVVFRQDATVAEVNAILTSINGRILSSFANNGAVSVGIPDPGSLAALHTLMDNLKTHAAIDMVLEDGIATPEVLPLQNYGDNTLPYLDHHLGVRGAAAWNARSALAISGPPPAFLIYDSFYNGMPSFPFNQVNWKNPGAFPTSCNSPALAICQHGYHVTGIALGDFGGTGNLGQVTGMYPSGAAVQKSVEGYVIDSMNPTTGNRLSLKRMLDNIPGRVVLNTSVSETLKCNHPTDAKAIADARLWLQLLRGPNLLVAPPSALESRYFHAAAAANNTCGGDDYPVAGIVDMASKQVGRYAASWTAASLIPDADLGAPALTNTLVVENREVIPGLPAPLASAAKPGCTYLGRALIGKLNMQPNTAFGASYTGGHVAAIGSRHAAPDGVWSYLDATPTGAGVMPGTSMATPQVAGLAMYLWTLRPDLTAPDVASRIKAHATTPACPLDPRSATPVIDAYATILSADQGFAAGMHPVRLAILDVAGADAKFDAQDTQAFLDAIFPDTGAALVPDYSRFDLNGDGFTGGLGTAAVNLDMSYDTQGKSTYSTVTTAQNSFALKLNEEQVTDFDVLCYYVNSDLFPQNELGLFEQQLQAVRSKPGRAGVTCAKPVAATIALSDSLGGWSGMPGTSQVDDLRAVSIPFFQAFGNNGCTFGERGGPIFSSTVDTDAVFLAASRATNVPAQLTNGINRSNCSSFVAYKNAASVPGAPLQLKLWINATGRSVTPGIFGRDWEYQTRLYSDGVTTTCKVGVVPNSGNFAASLTTSNCVGTLQFAPAQ